MSFNGLNFRFSLRAAGGLPPLLLLCGCFLHPDVPLQPLPPAPAAQDPPTKGAIRDAKRVSSLGEIATENAKPASPRGLMQQGGWYRRPFTSDESAAGIYNDSPISVEKNGPAAVNYRYRHAGVERFMARPAAERTNVTDMLTDSDRNVAATAAITLARQGDAKSAGKLVAAIEDDELPLNARCAAVEALGQLPGDGQTQMLRKLVDRYGRFRPGASADYQSDLHAELLRALARHVDAADDPRFLAGAAVPSAAVRIETLRAWAASKHGSMPLEIVDLRSDDDPRVRVMAMNALGAKKPAETLDYLKVALHDVDLPVRLAAIRAVGQIDGDKAQSIMADLLKDRSELLRAEAVSTIASRDSRVAVLAAANDKSWRVRLKVAEALTRYNDNEGALVARRLLDDPSAEVSRQIVRSLAAWPWDAAAPVLLEALSKNTVTVRKLAAEQLATRWPESGRFPFDGTPARRAEVLGQLQTRYQREISEKPVLVPAPPSASQRDEVSDERVEKLLDAADVQALAQIGPPVVKALERLAIERKRTLSEAVYRDVLPRHSAIFVSLDRLHSGDAEQRRRAVDELVAASARQPLSGLAVARLCELTANEADASVWIGALTAVRDCGLEPAVRIARLALGQPAAEVRRQGCEYLAAHPDPAHEVFLMPLLSDSTQDVVVTAIRALGAAGQVQDLDLLKKQIASPHEEVQLEAAKALLRLHDQSGEEAIERLSYSGDLMTRSRVAQAVGIVGDARLTGVLIRLLDDPKATVSHAALASLPLVVGRDEGRSADGTAGPAAEQITRWKKWYAQTTR